MFFGERGPRPEPKAEQSKGGAWKSNLLNAGLSSVMALLSSDRAPEPEPTADGSEEHVTPPEEFAARSEPKVRLDAPRSLEQETQQAEEAFQKEFAADLASPLTPERLDGLLDRLAVFNKAHPGTTDLGARFSLVGMPADVKSEADARQTFVTLDRFHQSATTAEAHVFLDRLVRVTMSQSEQHIPTLVVHGKQDFFEIQRTAQWMVGKVDKIEFEGMPTVIRRSDLPELQAFLLEATRRGGFQSEAGAEPGTLVFRYINSLKFDANDFPTSIQFRGDNARIVKEAQRLNEVGYYDYGIKAPEGPNDIKRSFGLGTELLTSSSFDGFPAVDLEHPEDYLRTIVDLYAMESAMQDNETWHKLMPAYLSKQDLSSLPPLDFEYVGTYQQFALDVSGMGLKSNGSSEMYMRVNPTSDAQLLLQQKVRERTLGTGNLRPESLARALKLLPKGYSAPDFEKQMELVFGRAVGPFEFDLSELEVIMQTYESSLLLKKIFLDSRFEHPVRISSVPTEWSPEMLLRALSPIDPAFRLKPDDVKMEVENQEAIQLVGDWREAKDWEDLGEVKDILRRNEAFTSNSYKRKMVLERMDFSHFPVFSASADALNDLYYSPAGSLALQSRIFSERLIERADFSDVPFVVTEKTIPQIVKERDALDQAFGAQIGERYLQQLTFQDFPQTLNEQTLSEVVSTLSLLKNSGGEQFASAYARTFQERATFTFAQVVTDENLETEYGKKIVEYYHLAYVEGNLTNQPMEVRLSVSTASTFQELLDGMVKISMVKEINKDAAEQMQKDFFQAIDWKKAVTGIDVLDVAKVEMLRDKINQTISSTAGDRLLIEVGTQAVEGEPASWENLEQKTLFAETYLQPDTKVGIDADVRGMYTLLGSFQATQILEFFGAQGVEFDDERVAPIIERLQAAGADIAVEDGAVQKVFRSWNSPSYVVTKAARKLMPGSEVLRPEWHGMHLEVEPGKNQMKLGYRMETWNAGEEELAQVVIGDPKVGARVDYAVQVGGGLNEMVIQERYPVGSVAAESVGAYTTGALKPAELTIDHGRVQNFLISDREGMVFVTGDGRIKIVHRDKLKQTDLDPDAPDEPLAFRQRLSDFSTMLALADKNKLDLMGGHLLVDEGELAVAEISSMVKDKRRALVTFQDGTFGLVDFSTTLTLYEEATILKKAHVQGAVNLDTGYYDHANVFTESGERIQLGDQDQDGTNNKFVFLVGTEPLAAAERTPPPARPGKSSLRSTL